MIEITCDGCDSRFPQEAAYYCSPWAYCGIDCHAESCTAAECHEDPDRAWDERYG